MTSVQDPFTFDARERHALEYLRPALDEALSKGRPAAIRFLPTSLELHELTALAVRLCRHLNANVGVLTIPEARGVIFTPFL
jgi:hypothetical protein